MDCGVEGDTYFVDLLRAEFLERLVEGRGDGTCVEIKFTRDCRVDLPAIFMISARRRGGARSSPLDGASMAASSPRNDLVKIYRCTDSLVDLCTGRAGVFICILLHLRGGALLVRFQYTGEAAEPDSNYILCGRAEHRAVLSR